MRLSCIYSLFPLKIIKSCDFNENLCEPCCKKHMTENFTATNAMEYSMEYSMERK